MTAPQASPEGQGTAEPGLAGPGYRTATAQPVAAFVARCGGCESLIEPHDWRATLLVSVRPCLLKHLNLCRACAGALKQVL